MIRIERLTTAHPLDQVAKLYSELYPHKAIRQDYVRWRYLENPFRPRAFVALEGGEIVGSYAACVFPARINGVHEPLGFELDALVHPRFEKRFLILGLYKHVISSLHEEGVKKVYACANVRGSKLFCDGFGWKRTSARSLFVSDVEETLRSTSSSDGEKFELDEVPGAEHAMLASKVIRHAKWESYVERSESMLRWRSTRTIGRDFRTLTLRSDSGTVNAFALFKLFVNEVNKPPVGDLIELIGCTSEHFSKLLHKTVTLLRERGARELATWGFPQYRPEQLAQFGFAAVPVISDILVTGWNPKDGDFLITMFDAEMF